ncbi:hypothetical protein [Dyadobacter sp. CY356]|uniref:DUF968 domain-containing protein n=1 Tax=Dyadobacter sp. CY356 TaxID=2906442 RepID=UPI001F23EBEB|nr:hypothetical protein [Dyadobacter sp. CY356]MCF0055554.1 hypothetical protein [Dyadobacter sp. CY356]
MTLAFPKPEKRKKPDKADYKKRAFICDLPCLTCGLEGSTEPHHLKRHVLRGMGMKASDDFIVPLCHNCHMLGVELAGDETAWFASNGISNAVKISNDINKYYLSDNPENAHDYIMRRFL